MNLVKIFSVILLVGVGMLVYTQIRKSHDAAVTTVEDTPAVATTAPADEAPMVPDPVVESSAAAVTEPAPAPSDKLCNDLVKRLRPVNETCLIFTEFKRRRHCVESVPNQLEVREPVWRSCKAFIEPIRIEYLVKEKQKFPKQTMAFAK